MCVIILMLKNIRHTHTHTQINGKKEVPSTPADYKPGKKVSLLWVPEGEPPVSLETLEITLTLACVDGDFRYKESVGKFPFSENLDTHMHTHTHDCFTVQRSSRHSIRHRCDNKPPAAPSFPLTEEEA
eukprot:GHVR01165619.1.p1 GENE.GHVR01165619.1~~GHVR01165619.1.p1  ORF type:complete len:128 (+),score=45.96 GHVR01165619.1:27-410(+)